MSEAQSYDAIVIGGGFAGLVAAAYLVKAGRRVLVLEKREAVPTGPRSIFALDPRVVKDLRLNRRGLGFARRDLPLVGLRPDGAHIILSRDRHASARSIAAHSRADAAQFPAWRRAQFSLARALRPLWWDDTPKRLFWPSQRAMLEEMEVASAEALLATRFESDALKALLCFDAGAQGISPAEAGSALQPVWRAAQEVAGLQGATALTQGDTLMAALRLACMGAEIRHGAEVAGLLVRNGAVTGVHLAGAEEISVPFVLSTLSRAATRMLTPPGGLADRADARRNPRLAGDARFTVTLEEEPVIAGAPDNARFIVAGSGAHAEARSGLLPREPGLEFSRIAEKTLSVIMRPVPIHPKEGWDTFRPRLETLCLATLARYVRAMRVVSVETKIPRPDDKPLALLQTGRFATGLRGLFLCGDSAEPVAALSGRAARLAAERIVP